MNLDKVTSAIRDIAQKLDNYSSKQAPAKKLKNTEAFFWATSMLDKYELMCWSMLVWRKRKRKKKKTTNKRQRPSCLKTKNTGINQTKPGHRQREQEREWERDLPIPLLSFPDLFWQSPFLPFSLTILRPPVVLFLDLNSDEEGDASWHPKKQTPIKIGSEDLTKTDQYLW